MNKTMLKTIMVMGLPATTMFLYKGCISLWFKCVERVKKLFFCLYWSWRIESESNYKKSLWALQMKSLIFLFTCEKKQRKTHALDWSSRECIQGNQTQYSVLLCKNLLRIGNTDSARNWWMNKSPRLWYQLFCDRCEIGKQKIENVTDTIHN